MRTIDVVLCIVCVGLVSVGQVLLRAASVASGAAGVTGTQAWLNATSLIAVAVYGAAMLMWLWILGRVPLTLAFPFFGLSFLLVPLMANRFLGDPVSPATWAGGAIIMAGIAVANWRSS